MRRDETKLLLVEVLLLNHLLEYVVGIFFTLCWVSSRQDGVRFVSLISLIDGTHHQSAMKYCIECHVTVNAKKGFCTVLL